MDRLRGLLASLSDQFESLKPRDRWAAVGLVLFVGFVINLGALWWFRGVNNDAAATVRNAKQDLVSAQDMAAEYSLLKARIESAEARMGQFRANQMNTYLETWATNAAVNETLRVRPGNPQSVGDYTATSYTVEIDRVPLDGILSFLYAIETSPYPIKVQSAKFRVEERRDDRQMSVDLEVIAYTKGGV